MLDCNLRKMIMFSLVTKMTQRLELSFFVPDFDFTSLTFFFSPPLSLSLDAAEGSAQTPWGVEFESWNPNVRSSPTTWSLKRSSCESWRAKCRWAARFSPIKTLFHLDSDNNKYRWELCKLCHSGCATLFADCTIFKNSAVSWLLSERCFRL